MTTFSINDEHISRLKGLSNLSEKLERISDGTLLTFNNDKMTVHIYGNRSLVEYKIDIVNLVKHDNVENYTYILTDLNKLKLAIDKCNTNNGGVNISVDHEKNKIYVSSILDKTKISISCFDTITESEAEITVASWNKYVTSSNFTNNTVDLVINSDFINFADSVLKLMSISKDDSCSVIGASKNRVTYADRNAVITKTLSVDISNIDEPLYVTKSIYDFLKPIYKESKQDITITFSENRDFVKLESDIVGIKAIIPNEDTLISFPTQEEYETVVPEPHNMVSISVNRNNFAQELSKFDGIFSKESYAWKQINVVNSSNSLDDKVLNLSYSDSSAEINTSVPININSNTSSEVNFLFTIPGIIIDNILNIVSEDEININYSSVAEDEPHGFAVEIYTDTMKAAVTKLS